MNGHRSWHYYNTGHSVSCLFSESLFLGDLSESYDTGWLVDSSYESPHPLKPHWCCQPLQIPPTWPIQFWLTPSGQFHALNSSVKHWFILSLFVHVNFSLHQAYPTHPSSLAPNLTPSIWAMLFQHSPRKPRLVTLIQPTGGDCLWPDLS